MKQFKKDIVFFMEQDQDLRIFYSELVTNFFKSRVICLNDFEYFPKYLNNNSYYGGAAFIKLSEYEEFDQPSFEALYKKLSEMLITVYIYEHEEISREELTKKLGVDDKGFQFIENTSVAVFKALESYFST